MGSPLPLIASCGSSRLSRLKENNDVLLHGERWWSPAMYRQFEAELMREFLGDPDERETTREEQHEYDEQRAQEYDRVDHPDF